MKAALLLICLSLVACSPGNDERKAISTDEARRIGMHVLLNRYPNAEITSEESDSQTFTYRFSTNGVPVPSVVVVDRKAAQGHFEKGNR